MAEAGHTENLEQIGTAPVRPLLLNGLRMALILTMTSMACLDWFYVRAERWDTPPLIPVLALTELPFIVALVLLARISDPNRLTFGGGIAFATGLFSMLLSPLLLLGAGFAIWDTGNVYHNLVSLKKSLAAAFIIGVLLCITSWRFGKGRRTRFFIPLAGLVAYLIPTVSVLDNWTLVGSGAKKEESAWVNPSDQAFRAVTSIAACLIRHESSDPAQGFPQSLAEVRPDLNCDLQFMKPEPVAEYSMTYTPRIDPVTRQSTDFRLTALPFKKARGYSLTNPLMIDRRGILFFYEDWASGWGPPRIRIWGGSVLARLQKLAQEFTNDHSGRAPASFKELLNNIRDSWTGHIEGNGSSYRESNTYIEHYFAPRPEVPSRFAMSAVCEDYGRGCILSYFLDYDGVLHATPQPRPATSQDPVSLSCESSYQCGGVEWLPPDEPSRSQVLIAALQHSLSTTAVWFPPKKSEAATEESQQDRWARFTNARYAMTSLTACLIGHRAAHPEEGFPDSLQTITPDWHCNAKFLGSDPIPTYTLSYEPRREAAQIAKDFRLSAVPKTKGTYPLDPLMSDSHGVVFVFYGWSMLPKVVPEIHAFSAVNDSHLLALKYALENFAKKHGGRPPASLSVLVDQPMGIQRLELADSTGTLLKEGPYSVQYFPSSEAQPNGFAISATCQRYADDCIRSYFLDFGGIIHGTENQRAATPTDTPITRCETYGAGCDNDANWTMP